MVDNVEKPLKLYCGNEPAVFCAHNNKLSGAAKHIDIKFYVGMEPGSNHLSRTCQNKQDISGSAYKRPTTQSVQRTLSRHGFKGKPMIPVQRGPKNKTLFQTGKVIVAVNLMVITVMTRHALYTDLRWDGPNSDTEQE